MLIGKGSVSAGVDLKKIKADDIHVQKDTVDIHLPNAEIENIILNPSDFETFDEEGEWSSEAVTQIKIKMRDKIKERALQNHILEKAGQRAATIIENFLRATGFKKINYSFG